MVDDLRHGDAHAAGRSVVPHPGLPTQSCWKIRPRARRFWPRARGVSWWINTCWLTSAAPVGRAFMSGRG